MNGLRFAKWTCAVIVAIPFLLFAIAAGVASMMLLGLSHLSKSTADYILPSNITPYDPTHD